MELALFAVIPLLAFLVLLILGERFRKIAGITACLATAAGFFWSLLLVGTELSVTVPWVNSGGFQLKLSIGTDFLTGLLLPVVYAVSFLVQLYSMGYMKSDRHYTRFFAFIQLFIFSMTGIVIAGDLIVIYIFWELVGLSSYLLIGFWNYKARAVWAAKKAYIMNRIGDAAFLSGILLLVYHTGTVQFSELPKALNSLTSGQLTFVVLLLFGGSIGKSAQFPLSGWLPDAMEGPTPVSALIHAATMVAAGIFLMVRISFLLTPAAQMFVAGIGLITLVDGAVRAGKAWDIKRVLAYSTQSQLGLMIFAIGTGFWQTALLHLSAHAFFKAGLFLSAGSVIHALSGNPDSRFDPQDMRNMGGLRKHMPITFFCFLTTALALAGLPLFSGFLSKDAIFLAAWTKIGDWGFFGYAALLTAMVCTGLTAYYMTRQVGLVFFLKPRYDPTAVRPHDPSPVFWIPGIIFALLSFFFVFSLHPFDASGSWLLKNLKPDPLPHTIWIPLASVILSLSGIIFGVRKMETAMVTHVNSQHWLSKVRVLLDYSEKKHHTRFFLAPFQWVAVLVGYFDARVVDGMVGGAAALASKTARSVSWSDRTLIDGLVHLVSGSAVKAGNLIRFLHNGKIQSYYILTFISLILLTIWIITGVT